MVWEERLRKLAEEKRKQLREQLQEEDRKRAEFRRIYETYDPKIDRVCKEFAKAMRWEYERPKGRKIEEDINRGVVGYKMHRESYIKCYTVYHSFEIYLWPSEITVTGRKITSEKELWHKSETIFLGEFREEKLVQFLEKLYLS